MAGKGDKPRPLGTSRGEFEIRWAKIFNDEPTQKESGKMSEALQRAVPVRAVRYEADTGVLGFLPVNGVSAAGLTIVRLDDGQVFEPRQAEDGYLETVVQGWSRYALCTN